MTDSAEFLDLAAAIGCEVSLSGAERLLGYLDAMLLENRRVNLTGVRTREAAVMFHALDSVVLLRCIPDEAPVRALDIGTGNGFPGVAIACLFPETHVVLLDRTLKKLKAIERALESAGFDPQQFECVHADAAQAHTHGYRDSFDLITARAVGPPQDVARLADPLLAPGGRLITWLSEDTEAPDTPRPGMRKRSELTYTLPPPADRVRRLVSYSA